MPDEAAPAGRYRDRGDHKNAASDDVEEVVVPGGQHVGDHDDREQPREERSAWVGTCAGVAFLLFMKGDLRLIAVVPMVAALSLVLAPPAITDRVYSIFDPQNATRLDRVAMLHVGGRMVAAYPLTGVGPTMVERRYREFLASNEDQHVNPHLHNVPMQIAAERGLPALAVWLCFIVMLGAGLIRRLKIPESRFLAAAALSCIIAMLAAGQFEYNFGDSEFLMLFLVFMTLPFAPTADADARA